MSFCCVLLPLKIIFKIISVNFRNFGWVGGYIYIRAEVLKIAQLIQESPYFLDYQLLHARLLEYNLGE